MNWFIQTFINTHGTIFQKVSKGTLWALEWPQNAIQIILQLASHLLLYKVNLSHLKFRVPLIFAQRGAKISGSKKQVILGCEKINGSDFFSYFTNASTMQFSSRDVCFPLIISFSVVPRLPCAPHSAASPSMNSIAEIKHYLKLGVYKLTTN